MGKLISDSAYLKYVLDAYPGLGCHGGSGAWTTLGGIWPGTGATPAVIFRACILGPITMSGLATECSSEGREHPNIVSHL